MLFTHRNAVYNMLPPWARGWNLFRLIYAFVLIVDMLGDALLAAINIRFPGRYSNESLPRIGSDRRMWQGPNESADSFAARLSTWWDVAKHSGTFLTMAQQIAAYFLPDVARIEIVSNNGTRYTLGTDGSWTIDQTSWNWDRDYAQWSRFWVLIDNGDVGAMGTGQTVKPTFELPLEMPIELGGSSSGDVSVAQPNPWKAQPGSRFVGSDVPYLNYATSPTPDSTEIRRRMEAYRDPHTCCMGIILLLNHDAFWASPPNGTWKHWVNRNKVTARYWMGTAT